MKLLRPLILGVLLADMSPVCLAGPARAAGIDSLGWLAGTWRQVRGTRVVEERWSPPLAGGMLGATRILDGGRPRLYELLAIESDSAGVALYMRHFRPGLRPFGHDPGSDGYRLARVEGQRAVFVNPDSMNSSDAREVVYERFAVDSLLIRLVDVQAGREVFTDIRLARVP